LEITMKIELPSEVSNRTRTLARPALAWLRTIPAVATLLGLAGCADTTAHPAAAAPASATMPDAPPAASAPPQSQPSSRPFMIREAKLPAGFPPPGAAGQVIVKEYPPSRAAVVRHSGAAGNAQNSMFMSLFRHIQKNDIAMTAPVVMSYDESAAKNANAATRPVAMAFVYSDAKLGHPGADGIVDVEDLPSMTVASVGIRGSYDEDNLRDGLKLLQAWLKEHDGEYEPSGPPRYLGYNSPFVPAFMRFGEVQIPVKRK
jgi:DNA gyrase inhibitor GyrI